MCLIIVHCLTHGCTAGPPLKDIHNPHYRQISLLKKAVRIRERTLQCVGYASHRKSYIPCAQCIQLSPQNGLQYKVSGYLCSDFPGNNSFQINWMLHYIFFFHWGRGGDKFRNNKFRNKPRVTQSAKENEIRGEQGRFIIKVYAFEDTFTYILLPLAAAILQSFIKIASLQRNFLKERSNRFFRTNENKPPRNKSDLLSQSGVL